MLLITAPAVGRCASPPVTRSCQCLLASFRCCAHCCSTGVMATRARSLMLLASDSVCQMLQLRLIFKQKLAFRFVMPGAVVGTVAATASIFKQKLAFIQFLFTASVCRHKLSFYSCLFTAHTRQNRSIVTRCWVSLVPFTCSDDILPSRVSSTQHSLGMVLSDH